MESNGNLAVLASLVDLNARTSRCDVLLEENLEGLLVGKDIYGCGALGATGTTIADGLDPNFIRVRGIARLGAGNDERSSSGGGDESGEGSDGELHIE